MVLKAGQFAFPASGFQANRAEVLPLQLNVAQGAEKTTAGMARKDRAFLRMVKSTGFTFRQDRLCHVAARRRAKQSGKCLHLTRGAASRTTRQYTCIEKVTEQ